MADAGSASSLSSARPQVDVAPPPTASTSASASASQPTASSPSRSHSSPHTPPADHPLPLAALNLTIKSLKPALSLPLSASPLDLVSTAKTALHALHPTAVPPATHQRWLLKGKALADGSLLREYALEEGATVVLMIKAGYVAPPSPAPTADASASTAPQPIASEPAPADPTAPSAIPTLTLSDPSSSSPHALPPTSFTSPTALPPSEAHYHSIISQPSFWTGLDAYLKGQFGEVADAERFWEVVLLGQKRWLKEGEVARIRDETGITGMGGGMP